MEDDGRESELNKREASIRSAFEQLLQQFEDVLQSAAETSSTEAVVEIVNEMRQFVLNNLESGFIQKEAILQFLDAAKLSGNAYAIGTAYGMKFWVAYMDDTKAAVEENEEGRRILKTFPGYQKTAGYLGVVNNAVLGNVILHRYAEAYKNSQEGISLITDTSQLPFYYAFLNNASMILSHIGMYRQALDLLEKSISGIDHGQQSYAFATLYRYADTLMLDGQYEKARANFFRLLEMVKSEDVIMVWQVAPSLLELEFKLGNNEKAKEWYQVTMDSVERTHVVGIDAPAVTLAKARIDRINQEWESAEKGYQEFLSVNQMISGEYNLLKEIAEFYQEWGKKEKVLEIYQRMIQFHEESMRVAEDIMQSDREAEQQVSELAYEKLYHQFREISNIRGWISACMDYPGIYRCLCDHLREILPCNSIALYAMPSQQQDLYPVNEQRILLQEKSAYCFARAKSCLYSGTEEVEYDTSRCMDELPPIMGVDYSQGGSLLLLPVICHGQRMGLLCIYSKKTAAYGRNEIEMAKAVNDHLAIVFHNISQYMQVVLMSYMDYLTGIYNRTGIFKAYEDCYKRTELGFGVYMLDIDDFKKVNDTYGHDTGDRVLQLLGGLLKSFCTECVFGRYGGEEFLVIQPMNARDDMWKNGEAMLDMLNSNLKVQINETETLSITVSMGGHFMRHKEDIHAGISSADFQLYRAKRTGKHKFSYESYAAGRKEMI